jgi:hypothetical protein
MEAKTIAELLNDLHLMDPFHIDPCHGGLVPKRKALLYRFEFALLKMSLIVIDQCNFKFPNLFLSDVNKCPRRKASFS